MPVKTFKTIEEQILLLKNRGLIFQNEEDAKEILKKFNYFDIINGSEDILLKSRNPKIYENVYFEDFYKIYLFDSKLKKLTLEKIFEIEARLKSSIAHNFSKHFCINSTDLLKYTDRNCYQFPHSSTHALQQVFNQFELFRQTRIVNGQRQLGFVDKKKNEKDYIRAYRKPPLWVVIKDFSFGTLYYTYCFQQQIVKQDILSDFNLSLCDDFAFEQILHILKEARNNCAHLELISRFKIICGTKPEFNYYNDLKRLISVHSRFVEYFHLLKVLSLFCNITEIKRCIYEFYLDFYLSQRNKIAERVLKRMGLLDIDEWLKI